MPDEPWQDILDTAPDAMVLIGPNGVIGLVNRQLEELFGYERGELVGRKVEVLVPERLRDAHRQHRRSFMADPKLRPMGRGLDLVGVHKDGTEIPVEVSLSPVQRDVGIIVSAAIRDASLRVETERRLRELDRLKDEFLSVVSHELRTPLTAIAGFAQLLLSRGDRIDEAGRADMLERIARNAGEMDRLVSQLLDLSRLDADQIELQPEPVALAEAIAACVASLAMDVAARVEIAVDPGLRVVADVHALDRVLSNLVTNAVKFSPAEETVTVDAERVDGEVVVHVRDRGVGIPADEHERVFDRFHQIGAAQRGPRNGTGIGLSIVRRYVELQGGRVWLDSTPGEGATFSFSLPTV